MPTAVTQFHRPASKQGEYVLLQLALPGRPVRNIGVLLLDPASSSLYLKLRERWDDIADREDAELLERLDADLRAKQLEMGSEALLHYLEDTLSNALLMTEREPVSVTDFEITLQRLFEQHVEGKQGRVIPFKTHLPLYSLRAAATRFGEDMEVEAEDWVEAPPRLRLTEDMFVVRVVGRSMEPRIPDGSLCVFRANVVGSRQGKLLLVELRGVTDTSARYTVKRYKSEKTHTGEDEWRHSRIHLEPLNPEFEPMELEEGQFRVLGEFVQVLE